MPLTPTTTFRTASAALRGHVKPVLVTTPGIVPGLEATLVLRVFDGSSFENSTVRGESNPITISVGGGTLPPANLVGLQGFSLSAPPGGTPYSLTIPRGISTIANHLTHGGNTVTELLPSVPEGMLLYKYKPGYGFTVNSFQSGAWLRPAETLAPGEGALIRNPGNEFSIIFTGTKPSAQFPQLYRGLNLISLPVPNETLLPSPNEGDHVYQLDPSSQGMRISTFDGLDNNWIPSLPSLWTNVGASFFYRSFNQNLPVAPVDPGAVSHGVIYFSTRLLDAGVPNGLGDVRPVEARVTLADGTGVGEGFTAQLYGGLDGTPVDQLVPLAPATTFQTASTDARGYVKPVLVAPPGRDSG